MLKTVGTVGNPAFSSIQTVGPNCRATVAGTVGFALFASRLAQIPKPQTPPQQSTRHFPRQLYRQL